MKCTRLWEVEAVADARLAGAERASFERHLVTCLECQSESRALAALEERFRALPEPHRSELEVERLRSNLLRSANEQLLEPRRSMMPIFAAAAVVTMGIAAVMLLARAPKEPLIVARAEPVATPVVRDLVPEAAAPVPPLETVVAPSASVHPPPPPALFDRGVASFRRGDFEVADGELAAFAHAHPGDPRCEDAAYLRAVSRWRLGEREAAARLARDYLRAYPTGLRRIEAERIVDGTAQ